MKLQKKVEFSLKRENMKYDQCYLMNGGTSMPRKLTLNIVLDILELLSFKKCSLSTSELFLGTLRGHKHIELLEIDIDLTIQEITDLQNLLFRSVS